MSKTYSISDLTFWFYFDIKRKWHTFYWFRVGRLLLLEVDSEIAWRNKVCALWWWIIFQQIAALGTLENTVKLFLLINPVWFSKQNKIKMIIKHLAFLFQTFFKSFLCYLYMFHHVCKNLVFLLAIQ